MQSLAQLHNDACLNVNGTSAFNATRRKRTRSLASCQTLVFLRVDVNLKNLEQFAYNPESLFSMSWVISFWAFSSAVPPNHRLYTFRSPKSMSLACFFSLPCRYFFKPSTVSTSCSALMKGSALKRNCRPAFSEQKTRGSLFVESPEREAAWNRVHVR